VPISVNYWLAVKHGTGRASVDYTTSKGSGGPPAGAGQYLEIWISPEGAGEAPGPSALTLGVPPVTAMPPVKLLATCCRTYVAATDTGLTPAIAASPPPEPGRPLSVDWGLTALTPHGAGFAVAQDAQRDDSGLATTRNRGMPVDGAANCWGRAFGSVEVFRCLPSWRFGNRDGRLCAALHKRACWYCWRRV
jgi:hypothetical protein